MCSCSGGSKILIEKKQVSSTFNSSTNKYQRNWNCNLPFFFLVEFLFSNCAGLPTPQDKPIHYPKKLKNQRRAAAISRWSSLLHFHIGNLFYRIDFPGRLVSSHSFFNLQLHQCKAPPPLLNHKKAVFLAAAPHANCKPMICPPNQPCDVLIRCGIVTTWGCPVEGWGGSSILTWFGDFIPLLFKSLSPFLPPQTQAGSGQPLSWCINYAAPLPPPTWTKGGKMGGCFSQRGEQLRPPPLIAAAEGAAD